MPRINTTGKPHRRTMEYRQTTVSLTPEVDEQLNAEADRLGVTRSAVVRLAIQSWVSDGVMSEPSRSASEKRSARAGTDDQ